MSQEEGSQESSSDKSDQGGQTPSSAKRERARRPILLVGTVVVILAGIGFLATRPAAAPLAEVETFPDQGQQHVDPFGPSPAYNSIPATSGPHAPQPAPCGIYRQDVPDVFAVHNLEHGVVVIRYDPTLPPASLDDLEGFARGIGSHVLVAPRSGLDDPIILTAWTHLLRLSSIDRESIETFYNQFAQNGPERGVPCPNQVDEAPFNSR